MADKVELRDCLKQNIQWVSSDEKGFPFLAMVGNREWKLRLNDFPDEQLYTLFIGGKEIGNLDDFPPAWTRLQ